MPELAELRHTADYVNHASRHIGRFKSIRKNPAHKGGDLMPMTNDFSISAESRGKELMLTLTHHDGRTQKLLMTMGMAGFFEARLTQHKHGHLSFIGKDEDSRVGKVPTLQFIDVRRFGKWKWADGWSSNRGPDPVREYDDFVKNLQEKAKGSAGDKPIYLAMMEQKLFNGIGNYLRAEIIYRMNDLNPNTPMKDAIKRPGFLQLCKDVPSTAYTLGGGQLKDWKNPLGIDPSNFREFIQCYGKPGMAAFKDNKGRRFWCDPKWCK